MSRIIVAEDHERMRSAIARMLQQLGHDVVAVANGREALLSQREHPADVLLTDILMPEMDGNELIQTFRREFPQTRIIAMSGGMSRTDGRAHLQSAQGYGAEWALPKPFTAEQLEHVVAAACGPR